MSATEDQPFVPKGERAEVPYADDSAAAKEDERTAESEATGKVPASEVEDLKDTIGGGEVLDDSEGYTRSAKPEGGYAKADQELDAAVGADE